MERKFIEFFTGLDRNFGYCDLSNAKVNQDTGKLEIPIKDYGWKGRPVEDEDYKKHLEGSISIGIQPAINPQTGEEFTFEQYIRVVEANRKTEKELKEFVNSLTSSELSGGPEEFKDGPPCLQQLSKDKLEDGRDRFLYNYMVFAKKKYPDDWEEKVRYASREYFKNDGKWDDKKVEQKIKSWNQTESGYTCQDGVITAKCMEDVCYKRKYGKATDNVVEWPTFSSLTKINFDEPEFELTVLHRDRSGDEKSEQMSFKKGDAFLVQTDFRKQVATQLGIFLPKIKDKDYSLIMKVLFDGIESQKPPAGTTNKEKLFRYIKEYIHQVPATSHASFASGATFLKDDKAYFVYEKFHDFLRRKDWRIDDSKTGSWMKKWFKAEFGKRPRYPKTETQKQSNPQVECVAVPVELFKKEEAPDELITMLDKEDIL
jgi:hypothetical protein